MKRLPESDGVTVVGLVASLPRSDLLCARSLPSMTAQSRPLDHIVIVFDNERCTDALRLQLASISDHIPLSVICNARAQGAAGSWNTGIEFIKHRWPESYISILDDDDYWDQNHIETCVDMLRPLTGCDVVLSGLRILKDRHVFEEPLPESLTVDDFLTGNPGWQGSNTFIRLATLTKAGMFTDGMPSTNDRDLAVRVLSLPDVRLALSQRFTSNWYCLEREDALSRPGGLRKLQGLGQFYSMHIHDKQSRTVQNQFFDRCRELFHFSQTDILDASGVNKPGP